MPDNTVQITLEAVDKTREAFDQVKKSSESTFSSIQRDWLKFAAAGATIYGLIKGIKDFVSEAADAEDITKRLSLTAERAGYSWKTWGELIETWADSTAKLTHTTDDLVSKSLTTMLQYTTNIIEAQKGVVLALNMSRQTGESYESTLRIVGMTMAGYPEVAGRWVAQLRNVNAALGQTASLDEKNIWGMKGLTKAFGETMQLDTFNEKLSDLNIQWTRTKKTLGDLLLPVLTEVLDRFNSIARAAREAGESTSEYRERVAAEWYGYPTETKAKTKAVFGAEEGLPELVTPEQKDPYTALKILADAAKLRAQINELSNKGMETEATINSLYDARKTAIIADANVTKDKNLALQLQTNEIERQNALLDLRVKLAFDAAAYEEKRQEKLDQEWTSIKQVTAEYANLTGDLGRMAAAEKDILNWELEQGKITQQVYDIKLRMLEVAQKQRTAEQLLGTSAYGAGSYLKYGYEVMPGSLGETTDYENTQKQIEAMIGLQKEFGALTGDIKLQVEALRAENEQWEIANAQWLNPELIAARRKLLEQQIAQLSPMIQAWQGFGQEIAGAFSSAAASVVTGQQNMSEALKKIWSDLATYVIEQATKMLMMEALFGNQKGTYVSGQGLFGMLGGALGGLFGAKEGGYLPGPFIPIQQFAGGGYVNRPTLGMVGEGGEGEYIIPESRMGGGGQVIINNVSYHITAADAKSFDDMIRRNGGSVLSVTNESLRGRGTLHRALRRY